MPESEIIYTTSSINGKKYINNTQGNKLHSTVCCRVLGILKFSCKPDDIHWDDCKFSLSNVILWLPGTEIKNIITTTTAIMEYGRLWLLMWWYII